MASRENLPVRNRSHGRQVSTDERRRVAMPRRSTRGPLDDDGPLGAGSNLSTPAASRPTSTVMTDLPPSPEPGQINTLVSTTTMNTPNPQQSRASSPSAPRIDLSFLLRPTLYNPMPSRDVAQQFIQSSHQPAPDRDLSYLLSNGFFRHAAARAADDLTSGTISPFSHNEIFSFYHIRLSCLVLISHPEFAAQEARPLTEWLARNSSSRTSTLTEREQRIDAQLVPWALRLLLQRLQVVGTGDGRRGVMNLYSLASECRVSAASAVARGANTEAETWRARLADLGIRVANGLVEMGETETAIRHLDSLQGSETPSDTVDPQLASRKALLYLRIGDVSGAERALSSSTQSSTNDTTERAVLDALIAFSHSDYDLATFKLAALHAENPSNELVATNYAVSLLYSGHLQQGQEVLEALVGTSQVSSETLFNLATMYELRSERSADAKAALAQSVADHGPGERGWERSAGEFKL